MDFETGADFIDVTVMLQAIHRTHLDTEAMTAAAIAAVTLASMLPGAAIEFVRLAPGVKKEPVDGIVRRAGVLVLSDTMAAGKSEDRSGALIRQALENHDVQVVEFAILPDEPRQIRDTLLNWCDTLALDLVVTTGGTGLGPRDNTPDAFDDLLERPFPGIVDAMRSHGQERTARAMLSRGRAGQRGRTVMVALPGSARAVAECLAVLFPAVLHAFPIMEGGGHGAP